MELCRSECTVYLFMSHLIMLSWQELGRQLEAAVAEGAGQPDAFPHELLPEGSPEMAGRLSPTPTQMPGLQDVRGAWHGSFQAYGGGGGAASVDFNLKGQDWRWGAYALDQVGSAGCSHGHARQWVWFGVLYDLVAAVSVEFDLKGQDCQWVGVALDQELLPAMVMLALGCDVLS